MVTVIGMLEIQQVLMIRVGEGWRERDRSKSTHPSWKMVIEIPDTLDIMHTKELLCISPNVHNQLPLGVCLC